ncbi:MAG: plasmid replication initiator RepA, partial [Ruegeria sp.]
DVIVVTRIGTAPQGAAPVLAPETLDAARARAPGHDVYALQAEWQAWWEDTGRPRLTRPDRAFLGWVDKRIGRGD